MAQPLLKHHIGAAIDISLVELKARFGGLVSDEVTLTILDSFKVFNHDAWPSSPANLMTFGEESVADLIKHFEEPLKR